MAHPIVYREDKLKELALYISARCEHLRRFGATKLNKVLFYADFAAFKRRGRPITGADYQRLPHGPAPVRMLPIQQQLQQEGRAVVRTRPVTQGGPWVENRLIALAPADLSVFEPEEIALVEEVIEVFKHSTAATMSDMTHSLPGWLFSNDQAVIPYSTALLPKKRHPLATRDAERAKASVARFVAARAAR